MNDKINGIIKDGKVYIFDDKGNRRICQICTARKSLCEQPKLGIKSSCPMKECQPKFSQELTDKLNGKAN